MGRVTIIFLLLFVLAVLGGAAYLAYWQFPAPQKRVEKVLPDARFPK